MVRQHVVAIWSLLCLLNSIVEVAAIDCGGNEIKVQKPRTPPESNGCSKPDFIQVPGEEDFTYCCDRHDTCYAMCGSDKSFCEKDFEVCLKRLCRSTFSHNSECLGAASMYTMGTTMFGQEGYGGSQEQHCTCIPKTNPSPALAAAGGSDTPAVQLTAAEAHYVQLVEDFYATHGPADTPRKMTSEELVLSYTRTKKLPLYRLYYDLHKKYDHAIKHVEGRHKMNPPRPPEKKKKQPTVDAEATSSSEEIKAEPPVPPAGDKQEL